MNHHYVLAPHDPALEARAVALVAGHRPGHGVRAVATASREGDFGHVIALQAADQSGLHALLSELQVPAQTTASADTTPAGSVPLALSVCGDVPCELINNLFRFVPSQLPACNELVFVLVELRRPISELAKDFALPPFTSHQAGVAISDGNQLLLELANDDPAQLTADLEQVKAHADVLAVRTLHAAGRDMVRSPR